MFAFMSSGDFNHWLCSPEPMVAFIPALKKENEKKEEDKKEGRNYLHKEWMEEY
jgi:hypothetical protein